MKTKIEKLDILFTDLVSDLPRIMEDDNISVSSISLGDTTAADVTMVPMGDGNVTQADGNGTNVEHGSGPHGSVQGASGVTASTGAVGKETTTLKKPYGDLSSDHRDRTTMMSLYDAEN